MRKTDSYTIRPALSADAADIQDVLYRAWLFTYPNTEHGITVDDIESKFADRHTPEKIKRRVSLICDKPRNEMILVAKSIDSVVGLCDVIEHNDRNQLCAIYVLPDLHGQGIGHDLWFMAQAYIGRYKRTFLNVASYNNRAIGFYESLGFVDTGKRWVDESYRMKSGAFIPEMEMIL